MLSDDSSQPSPPASPVLAAISSLLNSKAAMIPPDIKPLKLDEGRREENTIMTNEISDLPQTKSVVQEQQIPTDPFADPVGAGYEPDMQKAMFSDPRRKLLNRLSHSGLLDGAANRMRQVRDLKEYPDIAALARVAKTKENFDEIMGSPQVRCVASPVAFANMREPQDFPELPMLPPAIGVAVSPASTSAGFDSLAFPDEYPSPEMLPVAYGDLTIFHLDTDTDAEACGSPPSRHSPAFSGCATPSPAGSGPLSEPTRMLDPQADMLWKLAGHGSPELKPLDAPEMETDGSVKTGVYLLSSPKVGPSGAPFAFAPFQGIFKPLDEEVFERRGIEIGMGALREEAAFVIDRASGGQAYVPTTARASIEERGVRKKGSVQQFVEGSVGPVEDFGMPRELQAAEAMVGLDNAQAVACFDIRIFNTDRHSGNLLLAGPRPHKIVCIDHGCALPAWWALESSRFDAWMEWPHVSAPPSPATLSLVSQVGTDLPQVIQELEKLGLPKQAIWTLEICTLLLQKCILKHGLTLRSVALLMTRAEPAEPCWLERTVASACIAAGVSAKFSPEGKYGDLQLQVDRKFVNHFLVPECASFDNKHLLNFRDAFFTSLDGAFSHTDVISAAKAAEDAARNPWD